MSNTEFFARLVGGLVLGSVGALSMGKVCAMKFTMKTFLLWIVVMLMLLGCVLLLAFCYKEELSYATR